MTWYDRQRWEAVARAAAERSAVRAGFSRWVTAGCFEHFLTVTMKPSGTGRQHGFGFCRRNVRRYLAHVAGIVDDDEAVLLVLRSPFYGLLVWERTKAGAWHAHAALAGGRIDYKRAHVIASADRAIGFVWIRPVRGGDGFGRYLGKYLAKGGNAESWELLGEWPKGGPQRV